MLATIDDRLVLWVTAHRWEPLNDPMVWLGDLDRLGAVWAVLGLAIGLWLGLGVLRAVALGLFAALVTFAADAASFGVKDLFTRPRPFEAHARIDPLYPVHSSSFPAGHAATAFAGATVLAYFAPRAAPALFALAAAIGVSRVYVGVHYPSDVLAGAALGAAVGGCAIGCVWLARRMSDSAPPGPTLEFDDDATRTEGDLPGGRARRTCAERPRPRRLGVRLERRERRADHGR